MTKDVWVRVKGTQTMDGQMDDPVEIIVPGDYYKKNDKHFLFYDEYTTEDGGVTRNKVIISDKYVDISKKGASQVAMLFEDGIRHRANYQTPFGAILMEFTTKDLKVIEEEDRLTVQICYSLGLNGEHHAECSLEMEIRSKEKFGL